MQMNFHPLVLCEYKKLVHQDIQLGGANSPAGCTLQKKRAQWDECQADLRFKKKNMMKIWHIINVLIWGMFQSPRRSTQVWCFCLFSGRLRQMLHVYHDLFPKFVSIALCRDLFLMRKLEMHKAPKTNRWKLKAHYVSFDTGSFNQNVQHLTSKHFKTDWNWRYFCFWYTGLTGVG